MRRVPDCHPDRKHASKGLCRRCYYLATDGVRYNRKREPGPPSCHPDREHKAKGLCSLCYDDMRKGRTGKDKRPYRLPPTCHPDAEYKGNGLCLSCYNKARYKRIGPSRWQDRKLRREYGITIDQYNEMLARQSGVCYICGKDDWRHGKTLAVDHRHSTGFVRGLLCGNCNRAVGLFEDNPELLRKAADYLDEFRRMEDGG